MRTNIDIDEALLKEAMALTGMKTKKDAVEAALRDQVRRIKASEAVKAAYGKLKWEGDLDAMRRAK